MSKRTIVKGSVELAEILGVSPNTICRWRRQGILTPATLVDFGGVILYDLDKVFECLNPHPIKPPTKWKPPRTRNA